MYGFDDVSCASSMGKMYYFLGETWNTFIMFCFGTSRLAMLRIIWDLQLSMFGKAKTQEQKVGLVS